MRKKGFTLVELLAVIVVIGVVIVLFIPYLLGAFNNAKNLISEYTKEDLSDSVKAYMEDYDMGLKQYTYQGSETITLSNGHTYKKGDVMTTYDFKLYVIENDGIDIPVTTLVEEGYYNDGCQYAGTKVLKTDGTYETIKEDTNCQTPSTCVTKGYIDYETTTGKKLYYITKEYNADIGDDCTSSEEENSVLYLTGYSAKTDSINITYKASDDVKTVTCGISTTKDNFKLVSDNTKSSCTINNLKNNTKYYFQICATTNDGKKVCKTNNKKTSQFTTPTITLTSDPIVPVNKFVTTDSATIAFSSNNVSTPTYYVKSTRNVDAVNGTIVENCGTDSLPSNCKSVSSNTIATNTWYRINSNLIEFTYSSDITNTDNVYAVTFDGVNYSSIVSGTIKMIDRTDPKINYSSEVRKTNTGIIYYDAYDIGSGIKDVTCKYGTDTNYTGTKVNASINSCLMYDLSQNTTYYYKICPIDMLGNPKTNPDSGCYTGSFTTESIVPPGITSTKEPESSLSSNGYVKTETVHVNFSDEGMYDGTYYVKTTKDGRAKSDTIGICGTSVSPGECSSWTTTEIKANTWYSVSSKFDIEFTTADDSNRTVYALSYDGNNYSSASTFTTAKIDTTNPTVYISSVSTTSNRATISFDAEDGQSGVGQIKAYAAKNKDDLSDSKGRVEASSITSEQAIFQSLDSNTTYYFKVCAYDKDGNGPTCSSITEVNTKKIVPPEVTITNNPVESLDGYVITSTVNVLFNTDSSIVQSPSFYIKTTGVATINKATIGSCGTANEPATSCTSTSLTTLQANIWYKVESKITLTYEEANDKNATLYLLEADGNSFGTTSTAIINRIFYLATNVTYSNSNSSVTNVEDALTELYDTFNGLRTDVVGAKSLTSDQATFNGKKSYILYEGEIFDNFTYEFNATPTKTTTLVNAGTAVSTTASHNIAISEAIVKKNANNSDGSVTVSDKYDSSTNASVGLAIGTNGAMVIANANGYYYSLLKYEADLSATHSYKFTVKNNVPILYIDGTTTITGSNPVGSITRLYTNGKVGKGDYGSFYGTMNNFVLSNKAV